MPSVGREKRAPMWVCRGLDTREGRLMQLSPTPHQRVSLLRLCRAHEERRRRDLHFLKLCAWLLQRLGHNAWQPEPEPRKVYSGIFSRWAEPRSHNTLPTWLREAPVGAPRAAERSFRARHATVCVLALVDCADGGGGRLQTVERAPLSSRPPSWLFGVRGREPAPITSPRAPARCGCASRRLNGIERRWRRERCANSPRRRRERSGQIGPNGARPAVDSRRPPARCSGGSSSSAHLGGAH